MSREKIEVFLERSDWSGLGELLVEKPGQVRRLIANLHEANDKSLKRTLGGFQIAAQVLPREKLLDLVRRLMWMLNEESGNNCPNAALALGHIAQVDAEAVEPHLPVLYVYADDPSSQMRATVRKGIAMVKMALAGKS